MMSLDTIGSGLYARIPLSFPSAAFFTAALTSSLVTERAITVVKSTMLPVGTGTRNEMPLNLPASAGITRPMALAAPVVVGMMFWAAAHAAI